MNSILNTKYLAWALLLFLIEVLIALFVDDEVIRPYGGDYLVVMLIYCTVRIIPNARVLPTALGTLLFSYLMETLQYFRIVEVLGLQKYPLATTVIGTSFAWIDILAYTLGIITILIIERKKWM